jgi:hypothetical protein
MITRVLVTVKTYPTLSVKYDELVCTAGFREDGSWVRIYPIPFRKQSYDEQYKKYDWIEVELIKNENDFRPESYRIKPGSRITVAGHLGTENNWEERKKICLKRVYHNLDDLIAEAKDPNRRTSLATFKPAQVLDFYAEETEREWDREKLKKIKAARDQMNLFSDEENLEEEFKIVKKLPYKFKYVFTDSTGKKRKLMIEDWEIGQLYWNCLRRHEGDEQKAIDDVRRKYFDDFAKEKDLYLFLGTTLRYHNVSRNPFIIVGTFYPKKDTQLKLF